MGRRRAKGVPAPTQAAPGDGGKEVKYKAEGGMTLISRDQYSLNHELCQSRDPPMSPARNDPSTAGHKNV